MAIPVKKATNCAVTRFFTLDNAQVLNLIVAPECDNKLVKPPSNKINTIIGIFHSISATCTTIVSNVRVNVFQIEKSEIIKLPLIIPINKAKNTFLVHIANPIANSGGMMDNHVPIMWYPPNDKYFIYSNTNLL